MQQEDQLWRASRRGLEASEGAPFGTSDERGKGNRKPWLTGDDRWFDACVGCLGCRSNIEPSAAIGCTIAVWDGNLTSEDMQQQMLRLASDPEWPPGPRQLVDGTTLGTVILPDPELLELLYEGTKLSERSASPLS